MFFPNKQIVNQLKHYKSEIKEVDDEQNDESVAKKEK